MTLKTEIAEYELLPSELIGKTIVTVKYFEIDCGEPTFEAKDHHLLDYGLQFDTLDKQSYYFIWDAQKVQYDLKVSKGQLMSELNHESNTKCYNVSGTDYWAVRLGEKIVGIKSYWSWFQVGSKQDKEYYPQSLKLTFENGLDVVISAVEINQHGQANGLADSISVFFDSQTIKKYGLEMT